MAYAEFTADNTGFADTQDAIRACVDNMAKVYGRAFIPSNAVYTPELSVAGKALALACGMSPDKAASLRAHELTAFYSVARKSPASAIRMALKQSPTPAPTSPAQPAPALPATVDPEALATALAALLDQSREDTALTLSRHAASLPALVAEELARIAPRPVVITLPDMPPVTVDRAHKALERVLRKCVARRNVYLVGGMGTGKTTLAQQIAQVMGLPFGMASSVFEEHKLFGYMSAAADKEGNPLYVSTDFRRIFEGGGVFLFDELDRSDPSVVVAFNAATANGMCAFPDKLVMRHPDCVLIAAGNTTLRGPSRDFNTAQKMDNSVLDRWQVIPVELDLELEQAVCINRDWLTYCRALRAAAQSQAIDLAVTPRASIEGAIAIAEGDTWEQAAEALIWKGLDRASQTRLEQAVPMSDYETSII